MSKVTIFAVLAGLIAVASAISPSDVEKDMANLVEESDMLVSGRASASVADAGGRTIGVYLEGIHHDQTQYESKRMYDVGAVATCQFLDHNLKTMRAGQRDIFKRSVDKEGWMDSRGNPSDHYIGVVVGMGGN